MNTTIQTNQFLRNTSQKNQFLRNSVILLGSTMSVMAGASIAPALPEMKQYFGDVENSELLVKILLTVPSLFIALFAPISGIILDKFGRKTALVAATVLYGISGTSGFFLDDLYLIIIGRAFLGISVSVIMSGYITVAGDLFQGPALNRFMGLQAAFMSFGGVLFLAVSGVLADIEWRHPFLIYLFAFMILPGILLFLKETKTISVTKASFFVREVFDGTKLTYIIAFISMALFLMIPVQFPFLISENSELSNTATGLLMSGWIFFSAVTSLLYKKIKATFSFNAIFSLAYLIWAAGYMLLFTSESIIFISVALALAGIGNGLVLPNIKVLLINIVPEAFRGRAVGALTMAFYLGQFFSPMLFNLLRFGNHIRFGFMMYGAFMLIMSALYFLYRNRSKI